MARVKCDCERCVLESRVRGVIRRGDKKEMRAMIRDMEMRLVTLEDEIDEAQHFIYHLVHDTEEEPEVKSYVN